MQQVCSAKPTYQQAPPAGAPERSSLTGRQSFLRLAAGSWRLSCGFQVRRFSLYLRKGKRNERQQAAIVQEQPTGRRGLQLPQSPSIILSPPLFVFSPSHVRFLLMALIEGRGYFSTAGEEAAAAAVGKVEAKEEAAKS